ncbi:hypothetical protein I7I51_03690 [Histoplasma capsulatum]|uniref:Uncharacterized protein n=1 Tax=Ajellomyces capsulatus TaxID=5037 RepID=A0A8A1M744_AJECA|nr:predicted protein [Histoplasma mississippiense (nom. inval.)]EDN07047.1 predicted protein [Histoplasma mississippiense (nom. inval.)]QSS61515.1 hypothetical protein I7I51_03690 [Histoplasma capsulatum]
MAKEKPSAHRVQTVKTGNKDIFMSIKPEHIDNIATRAKNHEYRRYLLPSSVRRIWFYTTRPVSRIEYVAHISRGKVPGEVPEDGGIGNADFNAGKKISKYAYEILDLWRLKQPISLKLAISRGLLKGPPQKYCWVPLSLLDNCPMDAQDHIIARAPQELSVEKAMKGSSPPEQSKETRGSTERGKITGFFSFSGAKSPA